MCAKRVLIVDDEDDIREIAQMSLEFAGWEVLTADRGIVAVETAATSLPDVILLDVMMPDLDGPQTLEHIRSDPRTSGIPVIFLTAKVQTSEQRALNSLSVSGVIAKPFDPMSLGDEVSRLLASSGLGAGPAAGPGSPASGPSAGFGGPTSGGGAV